MKSILSISIIIPVYNGERTIEKCLESLTKLDYPEQNHEVIVVDNNSTDKTKQIIERFHFKYVLEERLGAAAARNCGAKFAKGDILAFTDGDACVRRNWLLQIADAYKKYPQIDGIAGFSGGINYNIWAEFYQNYFEKNYFPFLGKQKDGIKNIDTKNFSIKKSTFFDIGGFNEKYTRAEDTDLGYRLFVKGYNIKYVPEVQVDHINPVDLRHQLNVMERTFKCVFKSFMSFDDISKKRLCPHYFRFYYKLIYSNYYVVKKYIRPFVKMLLGIFNKISVNSLLLLNYLGLKDSLYPIYLLSMKVAMFKGKIDSVIKS